MSNELRTALKHHQEGRLAEAARIYGQLLATNPGHADALHLLGVVTLQQGQPVRAAELIGKAVSLCPVEPAYQCNLAEAYRSLGQLDRAAACCRTALRLRPAYPEAANNLGLILLAQGQADEAAAHFREAIRLRPEFAMAHNNLGNAVRTVGDEEQALAHFRRALEINPDLAESHSNLGQLLLERDRPREALDHCREAVRLRPAFGEAQNNLGNVLRELDRLAEAHACYREALRLNPDLAMTYSNVGQACQEEGKLDEAVSWYHQALRREPATVRFHCNLASALAAQDRLNDALERYDTALRLDPSSAEAHVGLGSVLLDMGQPREAEEHFRAAIRLRPNLAIAYVNLGHVLEELGRLDEAEASFREALRHRPEAAGALAQLAVMRRGKVPDADVEAMQRLAADPERPERGKTMLHFGLAHVHDARGEYDAAAEHLRRGNALRRADWQRQGKAYDPPEHARFVEDLIAAFTPAFFERVRGWGLETVRPVFIVGLPRSATTLTEQILASHSQVFGAGELRLAREGFDSLPTVMARAGAGPFECLRDIDRLAVRRLAQKHLDRLREHDDVAPRIVDKMPDNYLYLGWLAMLFPKARFIHTRRDLRDVAVSCWMTNFKQIRWANDPDDIASRFREYARLMDHWRRVLPVALLEVDYEETVADLESVARRLVDWCGLEWEPQCLDFHRTARPVRTASVAQVREPIYSRSLRRWKHYEASLGPLFCQLPVCALDP